MYEKILAVAKARKIEYAKDYPLSKITSFQTGGPADYLFLPASIKDMQALMLACMENDIPYYILGNGSNLLVSDSGIRGAVLRLATPMSAMEYLGNGQMRCEAGASVTALCNFALKQGLSGLEFAYGIPGSAGGAAYMNAGAYGGEMKDVLVKCTHIAPDGTIGSFSGDALDLGYRKSAYSKKGYCITELYLQMMPGNPQEIKAKMQENMAKRMEKQPLEYPSAGSTFKRPTGHFAGALIEGCGLKGFTVGGAQVSEKHAGFVINKDHATTRDIFQVIAGVQEKVKKETGVQLEPEVEIVGEV